MKRKDRATGREIVRISTHAVAGAFSGKSHHPWRLHAWKVQMKKLGELVDPFEKPGISVIVNGDFNRSHTKVMGTYIIY